MLTILRNYCTKGSTRERVQIEKYHNPFKLCTQSDHQSLTRPSCEPLTAVGPRDVPRVSAVMTGTQVRIRRDDALGNCGIMVIRWVLGCRPAGAARVGRRGAWWPASSIARWPRTHRRQGSRTPLREGRRDEYHRAADADRSLPPPAEVYRFTVDQYDRMVRNGTIDEDDPVELLDGIVVRKMPKGPRHDAASRCRRRLSRRCPPVGISVLRDRCGSLIKRAEPDLSVVRGDSDDYTDVIPARRTSP